MSDPTAHGEGASAGLFRDFAALVGSLLSYSRARLQLAGIESKEALVHFGIIAGLVIGALVVVVFGYIFLCIGCAFALARLFVHPDKWIFVLLGFGFLHFAAAVACAMIARARLSKPVFAETLNELKKDQLWLSQPKLQQKPH